VDLTTDVKFAMTPTVLEGEAVIITSERPMIRKDETNTNVIRSAEEIEAMPVRGLANLASTIAGVAKQDNDGTLNIRGGRGNENAVYIDGVLVNNPYNSANRSYVPNEAIEELSVQTGGFTAEYGEAMSGIIIMTTNTGSKNYSGSIQGITDQFLDTKSKKFQLGTYSYGYNEYTATFGGPIIPGARHTFFLSGTRRWMQDGAPSWGWAENTNKPDQFKGGVIPGNYDGTWALNGKLRFSLSKNFEVKASGVWTDRVYTEMTPINLYNTQHIPEDKTTHKSANVTFTHTIRPTTYYDLKFNYFDSEFKRYDSMYKENLSLYGNPYLVPDPTWQNEANWGNPYTARVNGDYFAPGCPNDDYSKNRTTAYGIDFDLTHQAGKYHTFKLGFGYRYHTLREYTFVINGPSAIDNKTAGSELELYRYADVRFYGYDIKGNEVSSGNYLDDVQRNAAGVPTSGYGSQEPYHPIYMNAYFQDKIEFEDLVLNLGLRYDRIDPNAWMFKQLAVQTDATGAPVDGTGMFGGDRIFSKADTKPSEAYDFISPRLGVSFPVSDKTMFHAQFGKFYQKPDLVDLYVSPFYLDRFASTGGYFTTIMNPNLRPEKTTSYEIGFKQMLSENASLQITAFYKETEDQIQVLSINTDVTNIAFRTNGDFGVSKGFDVIFNLRRSENLSGSLNYEYQTALGTGSATNTNFDIAWQGGARGNFPKFIQPLDFEQRHRGSVNVDYRLNEKQGPEVFGVHPFEKMGVNLLFTFYSGHPYTLMTVLNTNPHTGRYDNNRISQIPVSAVNANTTPWNQRFDLRIDRKFKLPVAGITMDWYLWVMNVLNTENIVNVWNTTGTPNSTGYLGTSAGQTYYNGLTTDEKKAFGMREMDYLNYGTPRQIRLGCRLSF